MSHLSGRGCAVRALPQHPIAVAQDQSISDVSVPHHEVVKGGRGDKSPLLVQKSGELLLNRGDI